MKKFRTQFTIKLLNDLGIFEGEDGIFRKGPPTKTTERPAKTKKSDKPKKEKKVDFFMIIFKKEFPDVEIEDEFRFHETRKWRFDYALPALKIAIECDGGIFMKGGAHSMPTNIQRDMEKGTAAVADGWRLLRFQPNEMDPFGEPEKFNKTLRTINDTIQRAKLS